MAHAKTSTLPPTLRQTRFFASLRRIRKEISGMKRRRPRDPQTARAMGLESRARHACRYSAGLRHHFLRHGIQRSSRRAKPKLRCWGKTRTVGKFCRTKASLPSVDALSTTMISLSGYRSRAATTEGRNFSNSSRPFQLGMTMLAACRRGATFGALCRLPNSLKQQIRRAKRNRGNQQEQRTGQAKKKLRSRRG